MGTKPHRPDLSKTAWHGAHDDQARAQGPGERPGVTGTMHSTLTAPNGTKYDQDGKATPVATGSTTGTVTAIFDITLAPTPANRTLHAAGSTDAIAQAERATPTNATAALGDWKLEVAFALGPTPVPTVTNAWKGQLTSYRLEARAAVPASR